MANGIQYNSANEIYTSGDLINSFATFLSLNGIRYNLFELSTDSLTNTQRYHWASFFARSNKNEDLPFYRLQKEMCILCGEDGKNHLMFWNDSDTTGVSNSMSYEKVDYYDLLSKLPTNVKKTILTIIGIGDLPKFQLLIPNSINPSTTHTSKEKMVLIYQNIIDFYAMKTDPILIKSHPSNPDIFNKYYSRKELISGEFPIELLRLNEKIKISRLIYVTTGAVKSLKNLCDEFLPIGSDYFRLFPHFYKLYVAHDFILYLYDNKPLPDLYQNYTNDQIFVKNHIQYAHQIPNMNFTEGKTKNQACILDYDLDTVDNRPTVFININKIYSLFTIKITEEMIVIPINISLKRTSENSLIDNLTEIIYARIPKKLYNRALRFKKQLELKHSKATMCIEVLNVDRLWTPEIVNYLYNQNPKTRNINSLIKIVKNLQCSDDEYSKQESFMILLSLASGGNSFSQGCLGRAYLSGIGTKVDINQAKYWLKKAVENNINSAKMDLFDVYWTTKDSTHYGEMKSLMEDLAKQGDPYAFGRLGRIYRYGLGVKTDLVIASEMMNKAVEGGVPWAKSELHEILKKINSDNQNNFKADD